MGGIAGALLAVGATAFALTGGEADGPADSTSAGSTAQVERRDLTESLTESGDLGFAGSDPAIARRSGTVTWLPRRGKVVKPGDRLLEVDEKPVTLMSGSVPAYRDLEYGVEDGIDVRQLERNLVNLGFDPYGEITVDKEFTSATTEAVIRWQEALGVEETGIVSLGDVIFMNGARRISALNVSLGTDIGSGSGTSGSPVAATAGTFESTPVAYTDAGIADGNGGVAPEQPETGDDTGGNQGQGQDKTGDGGAQPGGDSKEDDPEAESPDAVTPAGGAPITSGGYSGATPTQVGDSSDGGGSEAAPATEVMDTTSTRRAVTVELDAADQDFARKGARATVDMPDGSEAKGRIVSMSTVASEAEGEGAASGDDEDPELVVKVVIRLEGPGRKATAIEEAPVTVELERVIRRKALAVPVTAVGADAGGGYSVTVIDSSESAVLTPVEVGVFSDGYVEIKGKGIRPGVKVEVPE